METPVPLYKGVLRSKNFSYDFESYMNIPFNEGNVDSWRQRDIKLIIKVLDLINNKFKEILNRNCKFLISIIVNRQKREFEIRMDEFVEPFVSLLHGKQIYVKNQPNSRYLLKNEHTHDMLQNAKYPNEIVVSMFDTTNVPDAFPTKVSFKGKNYDLKNLSFVSHSSWRSYHIENSFVKN